jgi:hypothetical protein
MCKFTLFVLTLVVSGAFSTLAAQTAKKPAK